MDDAHGGNEELPATPGESRALARRERKVRRRFWPKLTANLARVPFADKAVAAYYATRDPRTPLGAKATLLGALAYFILPTDVIPDFLAGIGYGDDLAVLLAALQATRGYVREEHEARAREALARLDAGEGEDIAADIGGARERHDKRS